MVIRVSRASKEHAEAVSHVLGANSVKGEKPVVVTLRREGREDHVHGAVEVLEHLGLGPAGGVAELPRSVSNVTGSGDLRSDVVAQVAGQVEQQVPDRIAVGEGALPEQLGRERFDESVDVTPDALVVPGQAP